MLLALDLAFSNIGWTVWHGRQPFSCGLISTEKTHQKNILVRDDDSRRCCEVMRKLSAIIEAHGCEGIIGELPSGSQMARAAKMEGMIVCAANAISVFHDLPTEWCGEHDVKMAAGGKRNATKMEIMDNVIAMFGGKKDVGPVRTIKITKGKRKGKVVESQRVDYTFLGQKWAKGNFEHIADSAGAWMALRDRNLVKMFG